MGAKGEVKSTNADGVWGENLKQIIITVEPPFWKTVWFIILLVLPAVGGEQGVIIIFVRIACCQGVPDRIFLYSQGQADFVAGFKNGSATHHLQRPAYRVGHDIPG